MMAFGYSLYNITVEVYSSHCWNWCDKKVSDEIFSLGWKTFFKGVRSLGIKVLFAGVDKVLLIPIL